MAEIQKCGEFFNRIDKVITFNPLSEDDLREILTLELAAVQRRLLTSQAIDSFVFDVKEPAREFLLQEGTDKRYNARHLKRSVQVRLVQSLAALIASKQVICGDYIEVEHELGNESLSFFKISFQNSSLPAGESFSVENVA